MGECTLKRINMGDNNYRIANNTTVSLPAKDAETLFALGDGDCALLYLFVLRSGGTLDIAAAARTLRRSAAQVELTARRLSDAGLLSGGNVPLPGPDELPVYRTEDILRRSADDGAFRALLGECQRILGHTLSSADLNTLFGIYDRLGMTPETILLLIHHCADRLRRRYGEGRLPTMRAIEKEAFYWANREILTAPQAEEYLAELARRDEEMEKVRHALSLTGRDLTPTERKYIESWLSMGYGTEALAIAYDRTVVGTGKLAWAYMDKIVKSWYAKKLFTAAEIEKGDSRTAPAHGRAAAAESAPRRTGGGDDLDRLEKILKNIGG